MVTQMNKAENRQTISFNFKDLKELSKLTQPYNHQRSVFIKQIYHALSEILETLWLTEIMHERAELCTLLLSDDGLHLHQYLSNCTNQRIDSQKTIPAIKSYVLNPKDSKLYPGHELLCLFVLAKAKNNKQIVDYSELCEKIISSIDLIEAHLNGYLSDSDFNTEKIDQLFICWKKAFPYHT